MAKRKYVRCKMITIRGKRREMCRDRYGKFVVGSRERRRRQRRSR